MSTTTTPNAATDSDVVRRLQKEQASQAAVKRLTQRQFPHVVQRPGAKNMQRPLPTGYQNRAL